MAYKGQSIAKALSDYWRNGGAILYEDGVYSVDIYPHLDNKTSAHLTKIAMRVMGLSPEAICTIMDKIAKKEVTVEVCEWKNEEACSGFTNVLDTLPVREPRPALESMIAGYKYYISSAYTVPEMYIEHANAAMVMNGAGSYYAIRIDGCTFGYFFDLI